MNCDCRASCGGATQLYVRTPEFVLSSLAETAPLCTGGGEPSGPALFALTRRPSQSTFGDIPYPRPETLAQDHFSAAANLQAVGERMQIVLLPAIITITLALALYTAAVWWERAMGVLKGRHLLLFWLGFCCDTTGTTLMGRLVGGPFLLNFHGITGLLAVVLMLFHAVWGTVEIGRAHV
jgi:uncharacterized repeat protein (TIGR03987 family)